MKKIIIFATTVLLVGCATAKVERLSKTTSPVLQPQQQVFVALPQDGVFDNKKYDYSGQQVQQAFLDYLSSYANNVELANRTLSVAQARQTAYSQRADVLVYPIITLWEDRNTTWSGMRDKVKINVTVYDVKTNRVLDKTLLYSTSGYGSWSWWGNPSPSRLLKKVIRPYVKKLYHK